MRMFSSFMYKYTWEIVVRLGVLHLSKLAMSWKERSGNLWQLVDKTKEHEAGRRNDAPSKVRKTPLADTTQCWERRAKQPRTPWRRVHSSSALQRLGSHCTRFLPMHWQRLVQSLFQNSCLGWNILSNIIVEIVYWQILPRDDHAIGQVTSWNHLTSSVTAFTWNIVCVSFTKK